LKDRKTAGVDAIPAELLKIWYQYYS
jgi:hypothetical protein